MKRVDFVPDRQRVLVLSDTPEESRTATGIILPDNLKENKPNIGLVVRVGKGEEDIPMRYKVGDKVLYSDYSGVEVEMDLVDKGYHTYRVMNQMDIMGKIVEVN